MAFLGVTTTLPQANALLCDNLYSVLREVLAEWQIQDKFEDLGLNGCSVTHSLPKHKASERSFGADKQHQNSPINPPSAHFKA